ncbi:ABC transporter ATP-binding protein [Nocardioides sp. GCM10030258]|uniref:ABC transporter ATP-binding protein n=1 Tax=unclassified Nocardioides TaxID=2615069 RepID=UPI003618ED9E
MSINSSATQTLAEGPVLGTGHGKPTISVRNVRKAFGSHEILRGLSVDFVDGAITTILGPSGTGKSVLLSHIVGLLEPDSGTVEAFGQDIWGLREDERAEMRKRIGVLFQDGALFGDLDVYDNVAYPLRKNTDKTEDEIRDIVLARTAEVGLTAALNRTPSQLSGGMKKRAGFARALAVEPEVVLFDEPDSGLDPVRTSLLCDLILEAHSIHKGTYVVVTHDIGAARRLSDYVGVLWKGELIFFGTADEAFGSSDPFVQQFLSGSSAGPLGMD